MSDDNLNKVKNLIKEVNVDFENSYKEKLAELETLVKSNKGTADVEATIAKMDVRLNEVQRELDEANAQLKSSTFTTGSDRLDRQEKEYAAVADKMFRGKSLTAAETELKNVYEKSFNVGTANQGGVTVPKDTATQIAAMIQTKVPFLTLAQVRQTSFAETSFIVQTSNAANVIGTETSGAADTATPTIEEVLIRAYHIEAEPMVTREMLEDTAVDIIGFLRNEIAETIADKLGALIVAGTGTNQPKGILTSGGATSTYAVVKEINAAAGNLGGFLLDDLYGVKYDVDSRYRLAGACAWALGDEAMLKMRKLKDTTGQYLWQPSHQIGQPATFDGEAVYFAPYMPSLATPTAAVDAVIYGNFGKGLGIVQHTGGDFVVVDELTNKKYVKYYTKQRWGAGVIDGRALRILRTGAA